jgi:adenine-specific DNA-methyltransferase
MQNLLNYLTKLLDDYGEFTDENGNLLKNKIVEYALKFDSGLLRLLLKSKSIKKHFFTDVDGVLVFDKIKFQSFISNKEFLPDSYTAFKNKIGLADEKGDLISSSGNVTLVWPYKDCVLEGGQTKEDQKRDEIFWNETLAPDEIYRLFAPKVITNWKRFDEKGKHLLTGSEKIDFDKENFIIKGNNLLALHSIYKRFAGKVKLIYIDPPYNTGDDSFGYNDSFKESTWLTFIKNRLQIAKDLLSDTGFIFIQIDHHELGALNILLDEVFGKGNKIQQIAVKVASASGFKAVNPGPVDVLENILVYAKNKKKIEFKRNYVVTGYHRNYNLYLDNKSDNVEEWKLIPLKDKVLENAGYKNEKEFKVKMGETAALMLERLTEKFAFNNAQNVVSIRDLHKPTKQVKELQDRSRETRDTIFVYDKQDGNKTYLINGGALAFYSSKLQKVDGEIQVTELLSNFWDHISWAGIAKEGGISLKNGKKPEKLLKQILEIGTEEGDLVLDFFAGSGTLGAVAHKMGLQYILIEQMDYIHELPEKRLINVINGDLSGISKSVNWKGGGSFIYCELMEWNEAWMTKIQEAKTTAELKALWKNMSKNAYLNYYIDVKTINENISDFEKLSLKEQKRLLVETLDKNCLYVDYSEIKDRDYTVSETDIKLNSLFYSGK